MGLTQEQIDSLLKPKTPKATSAKHNVPEALKHPRPIQIGPLRYNEDSKPCASRNCSSPTLITVNGIRRCSTHALYALNQLLLTGYDLTICTCNAGRHSMQNVHTSDCPLYQQEVEPGQL